MEVSVSDLVESLAGRDAGELFYVLSTDDAYALLANGRNRTVEHPKRKKLKHLRRVNLMESEVTQMIRSGDKVLNAQLRRALALQRRSFPCQNQGGK